MRSWVGVCICSMSPQTKLLPCRRGSQTRDYVDILELGMFYPGARGQLDLALRRLRRRASPAITLAFRRAAAYHQSMSEVTQLLSAIDAETITMMATTRTKMTIEDNRRHGTSR